MDDGRRETEGGKKASLLSLFDGNPEYVISFWLVLLVLKKP